MATNNRPHMVINDNRVIVVPEEFKTLFAMQNDHNVESITFDCPRHWDDTDLSTLDIYISYTTPDGMPGSHKCTEVNVDETDEDLIHFVWTIMAPVTKLPGKISFLVCGQLVDGDYNVEQRWHTKPCGECLIEPGIPCLDDNADNVVVVPDNYSADAKFEELKTMIKNVEGRFLNYDSDNNGVVDNTEAVNGIVIGVDDKGVFIEDHESLGVT